MSETMPQDPNSPDYAAVVAAGYEFEGESITLGALVQGESATESAQVRIPLAMMNRHGLIAGATGTGKTRSLQGIAESLSDAGVPVFLTDIKGDLTGLAMPGEAKDFIAARAEDIGCAWSPAGYPLELYALGGVGTGVPLRTTVTDFGPLLMAKVLELNDTQESALTLIFAWADANGLALLDLADLRAVIQHLTSDEGKPELKAIGGIATSTAGVILREIATLQTQGGDDFFGEPAFDTADLLRIDADGRGIISSLQLPQLQDRPALFSTFVMWLLADLFRDLPEVGDEDRPRLVFFFDEAHLLFADASKDFLTQVVTTVRLIRSKGVGVFFATQTPKDIPADVLAQLGSRVQHQLRAFTPDDATALRATARTYPMSPYDLEQTLTQLGIGEAIVTVQGRKGVPTPVAWTRMVPPRSSMDTAPETTTASIVAASTLTPKYGTQVDRESAYELLAERAAARAEAQAAAEDDATKDTARKPGRGKAQDDGSFVSDVLESKMARDIARTATRELTRGLQRGLMGLFK